MKHFLMKFFLILSAAVLLVSCGGEPEPPQVSFPEGSTVMSVKGMSCVNCKAAIDKALMNVEGVEAVQVELKTDQVGLTGSANLMEVKQAITTAGYQVVNEP